MSLRSLEVDAVLSLQAWARVAEHVCHSRSYFHRHNLTETTKDLVKSSTDDVRQLADYEVYGDVSSLSPTQHAREAGLMRALLT